MPSEGSGRQLKWGREKGRIGAQLSGMEGWRDGGRKGEREGGREILPLCSYL